MKVSIEPAATKPLTVADVPAGRLFVGTCGAVAIMSRDLLQYTALKDGAIVSTANNRDLIIARILPIDCEIVVREPV